MIVIGCGKQKLDHEARASELYTGGLFRLARRYARLSGEPWGVLSAKYGLVRPEQRLFPYDQRLGLRGSALECWAGCEADKLVRFWGLSAGDRVTCLMGATYAKPFCRAARALGLRTFEPLEGLGLGQRMRWLSQRAALLEASGEPLRQEAVG